MVNRLRGAVRELIGRVQRVIMTINPFYRTQPTRDIHRPNAAFWDRVRHGVERGLELAGLFVKPLASKTASWVLGMAPRWQMASAKSQRLLNTWWAEHHADIVRAYEDAVGMGNVWVVVNADAEHSLTVLPPHVVEPIVSETDFSQVIGWRVTEVHQHPTRPTDKMTIIDEYTVERRVRKTLLNGVQVGAPEVFPNLLGRLPIVHVPNRRASDSLYGEPEAGPLLPLLKRYDRVLDKALAGNEHQGQPTPKAKFDDVQAMNAFIDQARAMGLIRTETVELPDGTTESHDTVDFQSDQMMFIAGGDFTYESPGQFAGDTVQLLEILFYLMLQYAEIPEFAWGNAIASSKASAESQLGPFVKWIEKKRAECSGWMIELAQVVLAYLSLTETGITVEKPRLGWEPLTDQDDTLTLQAVQWAYAEGLLDDETALEMLPVDIQDPKSVLRKARKERDARQAAQQDQRDTPPSDVDIARYLEDERRKQEAAGDAAA